MFIRAYLRASTSEQDASRAKGDLEQLASQHGCKIAATYTENESGTTLKRPELMRLLGDAHDGDVLLVEQVDRLSRLSDDDWSILKGMLADKSIKVVALDLPTSHMFLAQQQQDAFTGAMLKAINGMLLDMLAAIARKDYEDRRRRQRQGIDKAAAEGKYKGRQPDMEKRQRVMDLLKAGHSRREVERLTGASHGLVQKVATLMGD